MDPFQQRFNGIARLYGEKALKTFQSSHVAIIGIGGVGSWAAEALARSGVGQLTLIDLDEICISNSNRQLHTLHNTIGRLKVEVTASRLQQINPDLQIHCIADFFTSQTADTLLAQNYSGVIDAIDSLHNKCLLIAQCRARHLPIVTVGGAGGRQDPTQLRKGDLSLTTHDALLRRVRRELRNQFDFPAQNTFGVPAIFSMEAPVYPDTHGGICKTPQPNTSVAGGCEQGYGAASFVTGAFGFAAAAAILDELLKSRS